MQLFQDRMFILVLLSILFSMSGFSNLHAEESSSQYSESTVSHVPPVIPGLSGFGVSTVGGSGRHLKSPLTKMYRVNTLLDSGEGSLRKCVELSEPRVCLFEISGEVYLKKALKVSNPYITIAGQTAPNPGITLRGAGIEIKSHDVLIQHIAIRPGDSPEGPNPRSRDGVTIYGTPAPYNVVLDHVSVSWAIDENIGIGNTDVHDVSISNSIISESLHDSIHPKGPHGMGVLIGDNAKRISLTSNLLALNNERNPRLKEGSTVMLVNNVVYGWGGESSWHIVNMTGPKDTPIDLYAEGNVFRSAPFSPIGPVFFAKSAGKKNKVFLGDNYLFDESSLEANGRFIKLEDSSLFVKKLTSNISPADDVFSKLPRVEKKNAVSVWEQVLMKAGSRPCRRSAHDKKVVSHVTQRTGQIKDCLSGCRREVGYFESEKSRKKTLILPQDPFSLKSSYTHLEHWLFNLARDLTNCQE